jgi:predicted TIM-barrel fold metal-dependent hydrolase
MAAGASGIKIWKNIGMELLDSTGRYIMVDDPVFKPVFDYIEDNDIIVMGHCGEPKNCWLPLEEMTVKGNRDYYTQNPQYHMYLHPEAPSYEEQIEARDNLLEQHPRLRFIGAHLASLEWSVDELAKHLDRFPNASVDMASRINHLQYQSITNREGVRDFIINYQDRILYATDRSIRPNNTDLESLKEGVLNRWKNEWIFLATDSTFRSPMIDNEMIMGLQLPREVIDKIYFANAEFLFYIE